MGRGRGAPPPFNALPLVVETVLTQALVLPRGAVTPAYTTALMLELFRADETGAATAAFSLAARVFFKYLPLLDTALVSRAATWLAAHHAATRFVGFWKEWLPALDASAPTYAGFAPQREFLLDLIDQVFAHVGPFHHARIIAECFPPAFAPFLPAPTTTAAASPLFPATTTQAPLNDDDAATATSAQTTAAPSLPAETPDALAFAAEIAVRVKSRADVESLGEWLAAQTAVDEPSALRALVHALLLYGKANLRNAHTVFTRYCALLAGAVGGCVPAPDAAALEKAEVILKSIADVWRAAPSVISGVVAAAVETHVVAPAAVVTWAIRGSVGVSAAATATKTTPRWRLAALTCVEARGRSHRAAVRLSLFLGADVFDDVLIPELYEDDAALKEATLRESARDERARYELAVGAVIREAASLASRSMGDGDEEVARAALSHLRALAAEHAGAVRSEAGKAALTAAMTDAGYVPAVADALRSVASDPDGVQFFVPLPFARDRNVPPPANL